MRARPNKHINMRRKNEGSKGIQIFKSIKTESKKQKKNKKWNRIGKSNFFTKRMLV